jgi:hypothetical protein
MSFAKVEGMSHLLYVTSAPIVFLKPPTALTDPLSTITIPLATQPVEHHQPDFEVELVAVMGKAAKNVPESEILDYVLGYTCGNDVSFRFHQMNVSQWTFSKGFGECRFQYLVVISTYAWICRRGNTDWTMYRSCTCPARSSNARAEDSAKRRDHAKRPHQVSDFVLISRQEASLLIRCYF